MECHARCSLQLRGVWSELLGKHGLLTTIAILMDQVMAYKWYDNVRPLTYTTDGQGVDVYVIDS